MADTKLGTCTTPGCGEELQPGDYVRDDRTAHVNCDDPRGDNPAFGETDPASAEA